MLALGTIGLSYAPNAPCHHPPTARRSALLTAAEPSRWQVDAEAAFVAPAAPVPRRRRRAGQKTQKASSLRPRSPLARWHRRALSASSGSTPSSTAWRPPRPAVGAARLRGEAVPSATSSATTTPPPPRHHHHHPPPSSAGSPDCGSKNDRVMLLQPWLMLRGTWPQPRLASACAATPTTSRWRSVPRRHALGLAVAAGEGGRARRPPAQRGARGKRAAARPRPPAPRPPPPRRPPPPPRRRVSKPLDHLHGDALPCVLMTSRLSVELTKLAARDSVPSSRGGSSASSGAAPSTRRSPRCRSASRARSSASTRTGRSAPQR